MNGLQREGSILHDAALKRTSVENLLSHETVQTQTRFLDTDVDALRFTFEEDLQVSRVYNKAIHRHSSSSLTSTALYITAMSVFSKLSLSEVSNISFFALPIYAVDLSNSQHYTFGEVGAYGSRPSDSLIVNVSQDKTASLAVPRQETASLHGAKDTSANPRRLLGRFARRRERPVISEPALPAHVVHVRVDNETGQFKVSIALRS